MTAKRRRNYRFGLLAEWQCRVFLRLKGYRILASRYRTSAGEIDIVAMRGGTVAVIEVKARRSQAEAALALGDRQRTRLRRSAEILAARWPAVIIGRAVRFDLMLVAPWRWPRHVVNAWEGV